MSVKYSPFGIVCSRKLSVVSACQYSCCAELLSHSGIVVREHGRTSQMLLATIAVITSTRDKLSAVGTLVIHASQCVVPHHPMLCPGSL